MRALPPALPLGRSLNTYLPHWNSVCVRVLDKCGGCGINGAGSDGHTHANEFRD